VSDGLDGRRLATGTAVHETQAHDGLDREEHGSDEYGSEEVGSEEVTDEEDIDGETTDEHADAEIADDGGVGYEQVEVGLLPRDDNARRDRRDRRFCLLTLISCLFALAAVMYSAREPLPAYLAEPPQVPASLANLRPARPERLVPLDVAESVQAIVELYNPLLVAGLLAAHPWPTGIISDLAMLFLPEAVHSKMGGTLTFFDDLANNVSRFCGTIKLYSIAAGNPWRPNKKLEGLCYPLIQKSRAAATGYYNVAQGITGPPHRGTRWLEQLLREVLALAHAAAGPDGPGHNLEGAADYLAANASTSDRLRRQLRPQGSWQPMNSRFKAELRGVHLTCREIERMWVELAPVAREYITRSYVAWIMATAADDTSLGPLHAQVTSDLRQLESAITVVRELRHASLDSFETMIMAQQRLQELYDRLGCVNQACLVKRDGDDGNKAMERFVLADPSVLHEKLIGIADWLQGRMMLAEGAAEGDD
jgi:hypothetical protein